MLTSCPLRYVSRQIEHSEPVSPSDKAGDCEGERQIVTAGCFVQRFSMILGSYLI